MIIFGTHDPKTLEQFHAIEQRAEKAALMADGHAGYSMPIGGVAAYDNAVSVTGVEPLGIAKSGQVSPGVQQCVLDRVSRELAVPEDQSGRSVQPRDGSASEYGEGVMIASLCLLDETPLVHCCL